MGEPTVEVTRRGLDRMRGGHLWIYQSDIARLSGVGPGQIVRVVDDRGWFVGRAFYSQQSKITLRILTQDDVPCDRKFFADRLDRAIARRDALYGPEVEARRLVHSDGDLLPGLTVDQYKDVVVVQTVIQGTDLFKEMFYDLLQERLSPRSIVERNDGKVRAHEGLAIRSGVARGEDPGTIFFSDGLLTFAADPVNGQKTGAFLDQRENRIAVAEYVKPGWRCLDCFTHNGGFALHMARAGGRVTGVDISPDALEEARAAAAQNELEAEWIEANVFDWLREKTLTGQSFDLIVLDPPAFAKGKSALEGALRGYKEINLRALHLLKPGGLLVSCSCSYHMSEGLLRETILNAANDAGIRVQLVESRGASRDHPELLGVPESAYLKALVCRRAE